MEVKKEKSKAINRLQSMHPLRAKIDKSYRKSFEAMSEGRGAVWSMVSWWQADPIFKAMDLESVYPENYGAMVAASGVAEKYLDAADAEGFPTHLCGYARVNFGYVSRMRHYPEDKTAPMGGLPKPMLLLSSGHICDARVKWFQALGAYLDAPVWMMETPTPGVEELFAEGAYERAVEFIVDELREFIGFLEKLLGKKMDWDRYDEVVHDMIELCRIARMAYEIRKKKPCPVHSRDFWSVMPSYLFLLGDLKESISLFQDLLIEVKQRVEDGVGAVTPEEFRLAFGEIPPWHSLGFFDRLAERGWNFVVETWGYQPPLPFPGIGEITDPLRRHAVFHLHFISSRYRPARGDKEYFGYMGYPYLAMVRDYGCDGIVLHPILTCRSTSVHHPYLRNLLMEKAKVPSLLLEGDIVDLRLFDPVEALKKAEVFEEVMLHYREIR
jgi:benzoyl-CoA reductase subunit B